MYHKMNLQRTPIKEAPSRDYIPAKHVFYKESDGHMDKIDQRRAEEDQERLEKAYRNDERIHNIAKKQTDTAAKENKIIRIRENGARLLFESVLFDIYRKSIPLDESFLRKKEDRLKEYFVKTINQNAQMQPVLKNVGRYAFTAETRIVTELALICRNVNDMLCNRLTLEAQDPDVKADNLGAELNYDEAELMKKSLDKLSMDEITHLVKHKVVTVVADEKKAAEEQEEAIKATENEIIENDDIKSEEELEEALNLVYSKQEALKEFSVFGAMMFKSYKSLLEQADVEPTKPSEDDDEYEAPNVEFKDYENDHEEPAKTEDRVQDKALAEAVCQYTLLETLSTLKLVKYTTKQLKEMAHDTAYF